MRRDEIVDFLGALAGGCALLLFAAGILAIVLRLVF